MKEKAKMCPFLKKACIEHECMMFTHVTMDNPQTGAVKDEWICSIVMIPLMQMDTSKWTRGVQASVDMARAETQEGQRRFLELAEGAQKMKLTGS
jgi:hypothetical protein